jgi:membrane-bound lytic murein transglycosylase MltF
VIYVIYGTIAFALLSFGAKVKNTVEDEMTASSDSFTKWDTLFRLYGGDDWKILKAIAMNESSLGEYPSVKRGLQVPQDVEGSKSQDGKSWGLMQITIPTARDFDPDATAVALNNPEYSVRLAARLLRSLKRQFDKTEYVVKAYNQGAGNTRAEIAGKHGGYANEYWERFQRNFRIINEKQGDK